AGPAPAATSGEAYLAGTISGPGGQKLGGVTVSAKAAGGTITTSVYTDEHGAYYFPALPAVSYAVWAQADGFATANEKLTLTGNKKWDFTLKPLKDPERQL